MELHEETDGQLSFAEDVVNHPSHYCQDGGMECIDEMIAIFGKKADWYMKKYVELGGKAVNC